MMFMWVSNIICSWTWHVIWWTIPPQTFCELDKRWIYTLRERLITLRENLVFEYQFTCIDRKLYFTNYLCAVKSIEIYPFHPCKRTLYYSRDHYVVVLLHHKVQALIVSDTCSERRYPRTRITKQYEASGM